VLDLIIPVLNEEMRIGGTVAALSAEVAAHRLPVRLVVVDNGCVDATAAVVDSLRRNDVALEVVSCQTRGKGAAIRAAIMHSSAPFVGYCDADLSVPPEALHQTLALLLSGWDVVIGSRRCAGAKYVVPQKLGRRMGSLLIRTVSKRLRGAVADTQCGFKFFRTEVAKQLFEDSDIDGFAFDIEVIARALRSDTRLIELPVDWHDRAGSSFHAVSDGFRALQDVWVAHRSVRRWVSRRKAQ
jgi:glycosyltransferase involved in cell wall biosynthesis